MIVITVLAYAADAALILTYFLRRHRWFDWANALGAFPLLVVEVMAHAYPAVPLSIMFGLVGWYHILKREEHNA